MKGPSVYPVLDNRPIDQWKVTELKEELKRRKLTTKGLKEELVRRLNESIQKEIEAAKQQVDNECNSSQPNHVAEPVDMAQNSVETTPMGSAKGKADLHSQDTPNTGQDTPNTGQDTPNTGQDTPDLHNKSHHVTADLHTAANTDQSYGGRDQGNRNPVKVDDTAAQLVDEKVQGEVVAAHAISEELFPINASSAGMVSKEGESFRDRMGLSGQGVEDVGTGMVLQDSEDVRAPREDAKPDLSDPKLQVPEVSPSLGFPVKHDSISTASVSINETNDLEDNIIADNVKLELDVKPEMVQSSSSSVAPDVGKSHLMDADGGISHPSDAEEPLENKVSLEETDNNVTDMDMSKKSHSADLGSSEKLNLDRISGEDSNEEDALDSKQIDSKYACDEMDETSVKSGGQKANEESPVDVVGDDVSMQKNMDAAVVEKRKHLDDEAAPKHEPPKRQRRWTSESLPDKETQNSNSLSSRAPKDVPPATASTRSFSRSDSNISDDAPKERVVPLPTKPPTNSLKIDHFLRPFTLKAVQELLGKTGTVTSFWMDHIKTHCYVTYSSVDEAIETRNAVYNLKWPPNGGKLLIAEFVDPEEVKSKVEGPPQPPAPPAPVASGALAATAAVPSPRQAGGRQQPAQQPSLPPPSPLSSLPPGRERPLPPPPPPADKVDPPIITLDDLFRKTKATPRIYYLPLSEEQVREKMSTSEGRGRRNGVQERTFRQ